MPFCYHELFDHVAFPVFQTDRQGMILYKNPQAGKYQKHIRLRAKVDRLIKTKYSDERIVLAEDTPYQKGIRLDSGDGFLYLFLTRFQYPDGLYMMKQMLEAFGSQADDFLAAIHQAMSVSTQVPRIYADLLLITEQEKTDFGVDFYSLRDILQPLFERLTRAFSALGYRIEITTGDSLDAKYPVYLSPSDFLYRFLHILYLQMKLSTTKMIAVSLSLTKSHASYELLIETKTALAPTMLRAEDFVLHLPECEAEFRLLSKLKSFSEQTDLLVSDDGMATLTHYIPYETERKGIFVHSHTDSAKWEQLADLFITMLTKRLQP